MPNSDNRGMESWEIALEYRNKLYNERSYTFKKILSMNNEELKNKIFTFRRSSSVANQEAM